MCFAFHHDSGFSLNFQTSEMRSATRPKTARFTVRMRELWRSRNALLEMQAIGGNSTPPASQPEIPKATMFTWALQLGFELLKTTQ